MKRENLNDAQRGWVRAVVARIPPLSPDDVAELRRMMGYAPSAPTATSTDAPEATKTTTRAEP